MPALASNLRNLLEKTIITARDEAEQAARVALATLAVEKEAPFAGMSEAQRQLRRALRARARQLGSNDQQIGMPLLEQEIAYEQWHRMLFARFLAENNLLIHPELQVAVTLEECAELAAEEGAGDAWELAARYAAAILPGIFPIDDPAVQIRLAPEGRRTLEQLVQNLPPAVFTADDGLGWVYQFWQTKKKREINESGCKIGAAEIGPVTQLFTDDYMVRFLLENSLGAWWASRHPDSPLIHEWLYLRWLDDDTAETEDGGEKDKASNRRRVPAAGTFPGWPQSAAEVTLMDPCGGSGHFVVAGFEMLRRMRMAEEELSEAAAGDAVIRDNLFMLDIDPRCTQIATFNLVLAAWKAGGYRSLPVPNIACSGIAIEGQLADWLKLAGDDDRLRSALETLYKRFEQANILGSLIKLELETDLFTADYGEVFPLLEKALQRRKEADDPAAAVLGKAARGMLRAVRLLSRRYTLLATNVPFLSRGKQVEFLRAFVAQYYEEGKHDLATAFLDRCLEFCAKSVTTSIVLPQNWLFLTSYHRFREKLLKNDTWHLIARLGEGGFESPAAAGAFTVLITVSRGQAPTGHLIHGLDVSGLRTATEKAIQLKTAQIKPMGQRKQLENPDARVALNETTSTHYLQEYASGLAGILNGDSPRFLKVFWEIPDRKGLWSFQQTTQELSSPFGGLHNLVYYDEMNGHLREEEWIRREKLHNSDQRGQSVVGKRGVAVSSMRSLPVSFFLGSRFDSNVAVIVPHNPAHLPAIWCFCSSPEYNEAVRQVDQSLKVTNATLVKVPFDLDYWTQIAQEKYPNGLPEPFSNDPTQWLFTGHPVGATDPLQVAVARLLGYHWPQQADDGLARLADQDGIVCLPAVSGEPPAAERLRALLMAAYQQPPTLPDPAVYQLQSPDLPFDQLPAGWSLAVQQRLLAHVDYAGKSLDDWLRDGFFEQHCKLFHNRPLIWHLWDGRRDGFNVLVNYHKLDLATLNRLIYTYLGGWIESQRAARTAGEAGADGRLVAALELQKKLEAIRDGEPPYDIYVRWKPLHAQPIGWQPDLNDGVRLNIRPFVEAGILRRKFTINWKKDRGANPDGSERLNDLHYTRAAKETARAAHKRSQPPRPAAT